MWALCLLMVGFKISGATLLYSALKCSKGKVEHRLNNFPVRLTRFLVFVFHFTATKQTRKSHQAHSSSCFHAGSQTQKLRTVGGTVEFQNKIIK